jgi:hypothetical protein
MKKVLLVLSICFFVFVVSPQGIIYAGKCERPTYDFSQSRSLPYQNSDTVLFENVIVGNERYEMIMTFGKGGKFNPVSSRLLRTVQIPFANIVIDGDASDWAGVQPIETDPEGDKGDMFASTPGTDLKAVYIARDNTYLYFMMTMYDSGPMPLSDGIYVVEFQQYLNQIHTPGDLVCSAGYEGVNKWVAVGDRGPGWFISSYDLTYVALGSGWLEWKVPIADMQYPEQTPLPYWSPVPTPPGIQNQFIRAYIHPFPHPTTPVSDTNDHLNRPMIINFY